MRYQLISLFLLSLCTAAQAQWQHKVVGLRSLAFSPDSQTLAAGNIEDWASPGDLWVWKTKSGQLLHREHYVYGVEAVAFSPDGKTLAVGADVETAKLSVRLWNLRNWKVQHKFSDQYINSLAFSPDGKRLAVGSNMGENGETEVASVYQVPNGQRRKLPDSDGLSIMAFSPGGNLLAGGYYGGYYSDYTENMRVWNRQGKLLWQHDVPGLTEFAFLPGSDTMLIATSKSEEGAKRGINSLQFWDASRGKLMRSLKTQSSITALAVSKDGRKWATGDSQGNVRIWNPAKRSVVKTLRLHKAVVYELTFSPDGRWLASGGGDDVVQVTAVQ